MSVEALLIFLLIGAVAGFLAGIIVKGYGFGIVGNMIVGIVGSVFAGWLLADPDQLRAENRLSRIAFSVLGVVAVRSLRQR